ncbi:hypothetical protein ACHAWF_005161 [Thalassiosira exigua]
MDPVTPRVDRTGFNGTDDWAKFYGDEVEEDPPGMPEPLRKPVKIFAFCDSDHRSNGITMRYPTQGYSYSHRTHSFAALARSRTQWRRAHTVQNSSR